MVDLADCKFELEREHRILERHGATRRARMATMIVNGQPVLFETEVDDDRLWIVKSIVLPERLAGPLQRFASIKAEWLCRIGHSPWSATNIVSALEGQERMLRLMAPRAVFCQGSGWLVHRVIVLMIDPLRQVAFHRGENPGLVADAAFEGAIMKISQLLASADCAAA